MKNNCIKFLAALVLVFVAFSCDKKEKEVKIDLVDRFNVIIETEYDNLKEERPDVIFYTSMIELDTTVKDDIVVLNFTNIYQDKDTAIQIYHDINGCDVSYIPDHWMEDVKFDPSTLQVSLLEAYYKLMEADIVKPNPIHKVVLRSPLGPTIVNPMYIFGQGNYFVSVDAMTGEVKGISETEEVKKKETIEEKIENKYNSKLFREL